MNRRFYSDQLVQGEQVVLRGPEAHHLAHVLRSRPGEHVVLFDGSGAEFLAEVRAVKRHEVQLIVQTRHAISRELPGTLLMAVALPRGDRQEWLTQKLVELGVTALVPLQTQRSVALPGNQTQTRLERAVIEASKQCGRNRLLEIRRAMPFQAFLAEPTTALRLMAHPGQTSRPLGQVLAAMCVQPTSEFRAVIGPEGGFCDDERQLAQDLGWSLVDLGTRMLRTETAAVALAARLVLY